MEEAESIAISLGHRIAGLEWEIMMEQTPEQGIELSPEDNARG